MLTRTYAIAASVAVAALIGGTLFVTLGRGGDDPFAPCRESAIAGGAGSLGGPFTLVDGTGNTVTDADVITKPSLIYFGYTFCPDVCPLDNVRNADAVDILMERGYDIQPVFISVDPERDTPEVVAEYAGYMHPDMIGLTGSPDQVKAASKAYRTFYSKQETGDEFYLISHSTFSYLVLPDHGFVEFFRAAPTDAAAGLEAPDLAEQITCFLDAA